MILTFLKDSTRLLAVAGFRERGFRSSESSAF